VSWPFRPRGNAALQPPRANAAVLFQEINCADLPAFVRLLTYSVPWILSTSLTSLTMYNASTMPPKVNIGTRVPQQQNEQIEEYAERRGLNKSEAQRELLEIGLERENQEPTFFADTAAYMTGVAAAASFALLVSVVVIGVAGVAGVVLGPSPWQLLAALSVTIIVAALGISFRVVGVVDRLDAALGRAEKRLMEA